MQLLGPKDTSPETTQTIFHYVAPILGVVLFLVGLGVLAAFWRALKQRGEVKRIRRQGPQTLDQAEVGADVWLRGTARTHKAVPHPFEDSDCIYWSVVATHLVREKVSNDAGYTDRRRELFSARKGDRTEVDVDGTPLEIELLQCDYRTLEGEDYTAEELPPRAREWLERQGVDLEARELEVTALHLPVEAEVSVLGRVARDDHGDLTLEDTGPTGLALSVSGLDEYIDSLAEGQLSTLLWGLFLVGGGLALVGRFFFG